MPPRFLPLLALAVGFAAAGCVGTVPPSDGPADLPANATEADVVDYANLSTAQRNAFTEARNRSVTFGAGVPADVATIDYSARIVDAFRDHAYVRRDHTYYRIDLVRNVVGRERLDAEPVEDTGDGSVVDLENVSGENVRLVERAIEDGSVTRDRVALPGRIEAGDVVEYRGGRYRLSVRNLDYVWFTMTVEAVGTS